MNDSAPAAPAATTLSDAELAKRKSEIGGPYAWYVLTLLVIVYMFNFIDRQILSILAEDIKRDLNIDDAQMGFLYGTAFAVFYALFGIPLGRLADNWLRGKLMALGLALWSGMTAVSGFANSFLHLSIARIGVGIGEASASPSAFSMLSDYFPKEKRATALAIYSSGLYIGGGASLFIGALVVDRWNQAFPDGGPMGLVGWQAAFLAVGLPGILLALWVATIREPVRGLADGLVTPPATNVWGKFWDDLTSVLPPLTLIHIARYGQKALITNIIAAVVVGAIAFTLIRLTGDLPQWTALGIGAYAVFTWAQSLKERDAPTFKLIWGTPTFLFAVVGFGTISFVGYSLGFWTAPYVMRTFVPAYQALVESGQISEIPWYAQKAYIGLMIGGTGAASGFLGVILGGSLADKFKAINPAGRIWVGFIAALVPIPFIIWQFTTDSLPLVYALNFVQGIAGAMWVGVAAATCQDLVMPRMRGAATATYFIGTTIIGLGLGPYIAGKISKVSGSLATGCLSLLAIVPLTVFCLWMVYRSLPLAEASRIDRARAAGEAV
jgi:MFS family permease